MHGASYVACKENYKRKANCMRERERGIDLQEELKRNEFLVFLMNKKVEDAPLSEFMKDHDPKQCSPKCEQQHQPVWLPSMTMISMVMPTTITVAIPLMIRSTHCNELRDQSFLLSCWTKQNKREIKQERIKEKEGDGSLSLSLSLSIFYKDSFILYILD